jgi:hypothetical protein
LIRDLEAIPLAPDGSALVAIVEDLSAIRDGTGLRTDGGITVVRIRLNPLRNQRFPDGTASQFPDQSPRDLCTALLHELVHTRDILLGTTPPGSLNLRLIRYADSAVSSETRPVICEEIKALVYENRYRKLAGIGQRPTYTLNAQNPADTRLGLLLPGAPGQPNTYGFSVFDPPQETFSAGPCGLL